MNDGITGCAPHILRELRVGTPKATTEKDRKSPTTHSLQRVCFAANLTPFGCLSPPLRPFVFISPEFGKLLFVRFQLLSESLVRLTGGAKRSASLVISCSNGLEFGATTHLHNTQDSEPERVRVTRNHQFGFDFLLLLQKLECGSLCLGFCFGCTVTVAFHAVQHTNSYECFAH
jgi:hypothetical protein